MSEHEDSRNDRDQSTDNELVNGRWTARDGSDFHKTMRHEANWRYERDDCQYDVQCELEVGFHDPAGNEIGYGFADLVIDNKHVIDFKTDQMTEWTEASARAQGHKYGSKVASYANSPQMDDDAEGHLFMVGNRNRNEHIESIFREAVAEHGVTVVFCDSGDPEIVLNQIEDRFMPLERSRAAENELTEMVAAPREIGETRSYLNEVLLDTHDALNTVKSELGQKLDQTYASVETAWDAIEVPSAPTANAGVSSLVLAPILFKAIEQQWENSWVGQRVTEFIDEWKMNRDLKEINIIPQETLPDVAEEAIATMQAVQEVTQQTHEVEATPAICESPEIAATEVAMEQAQLEPEMESAPAAEIDLAVDPGTENEF